MNKIEIRIKRHSGVGRKIQKLKSTRTEMENSLERFKGRCKQTEGDSELEEKENRSY